MGTEIERRFLVSRDAIDPALRERGARRIAQGYMAATPTEHLRVRIIDDRVAMLTKKSGSGLIREESEQGIDLKVARLLLEQCSLRIDKRRFMIDGFEVDVYDSPLDHLIIVERELIHPDEVVDRPPWIKSWTEVTDSLTNLHLARAAAELRAHGNRDWVHFIAPVPVIVLTGGPCSGKSSLIADIQAHLPEVRFVPEMATLLMQTIGIAPATHPHDPYTFNRALYRMQVALEEASAIQAYREGKRLVVVDRGTMDIAAYLPNKVRDLPLIGAGTVTSEYARYMAVICLAPPPREVYERRRTNNPARSESFDEALLLYEKTQAAWAGHHRFLMVDGHDWEEKRERALKLITAHLTLPPT